MNKMVVVVLCVLSVQFKKVNAEKTELNYKIICGVKLEFEL